MTNRREFLAAGAAASSMAALAHSGESDSGTLRVGVMGLNRGLSLAEDFVRLPDVELAYLCDVDAKRAKNAAKQLNDKTDSTAKVVNDFREILADKSIDVFVCAAPNHWHGPATIMACKAGKHVYVEKPCSHNPLEGEWMIKASEKHDRRVQMGTQRRSAAGTLDAMKILHSGGIGKIHLARCYYHNQRGPTGRRTVAELPEGLDYELWQGPVPHVEYQSNVIPYKWHWYWHWGGGELANNGVHGLDLCRWGLQVGLPSRTVSSGGRYFFADDQETPDTQSVCFEFEGGKQITWDALSCNRHGPGLICSFYGDNGALELDSDGTYRQYDRKNKIVSEGKGTGVGQKEHIENFVSAIRAGDSSKLNQPITEGHKSTLLCHLGNIAYRTERPVVSDSVTGHITGDEEQQSMWRRSYEPEWEEDVSMT